MKTVCFTGHRNISNTEIIRCKLKKILEILVKNDITEFYTGGAVGFDTISAYTIIELRKKYPNIKLNLVLPCCKKEQTLKWNKSQINDYEKIFSEADTIQFVSEHYFNGCMKLRNARLIELADYCICFYNPKKYKSGTAQTVHMAKNKNIEIINISEL